MRLIEDEQNKSVCDGETQKERVLGERVHHSRTIVSDEKTTLYCLSRGERRVLSRNHYWSMGQESRRVRDAGEVTGGTEKAARLV